jgi:hypothetical protein
VRGAIAFAVHKVVVREGKWVLALYARIVFDSRVTRSNRYVHKALRCTLITFESREIHSPSFSRPGKIILQIPAMPLGLFQKPIGK